jgi:uncharacterized membrane protein YeaQ/YmgE (transglycosylase-associated protein family)
MDPGIQETPMASLKSLVDNWVLMAQGIVGSIGALALLAAFVCRMVAADPRSAYEAKRWIGRIVVGTVGAELAGTLTQALIATIPNSMR